MAMQQKLVLQAKLSQKLILTPSLQQAIKLLPMSTLELADMLNQEITENPLLEEDAEAAANEETPTPERREKKQQRDCEETQTSEEKPEEKTDDSFSEIDEEAFFSDYLDEGYRPRMSFEVPELPPIENTLATTSSLADHLDWQLRLSTSDELDFGDWARHYRERRRRRISPGFGRRNLCHGRLPLRRGAQGPRFGSELRPHRSRCSRSERVSPVSDSDTSSLADTPGRDHGRGALGSYSRATGSGTLPRRWGFPKRRSSTIARSSGDLDPNPGSKHTPKKSQYVTPDVYVVKVDDNYEIVLNEDRLPQLRISSLYRRMLENKSADNEETRVLCQGEAPQRSVAHQVG